VASTLDLGGRTAVACQITVPRGTIRRFDPSGLIRKNMIRTIEIDGQSRPAGGAIVLAAGLYRITMYCK
jgi:hypothetical protein